MIGFERGVDKSEISALRPVPAGEWEVRPGYRDVTPSNLSLMALLTA
jgi:hypothetical protein